MANVEFLRECGIQEWILDGDESFKDFFAWFNNNVSGHNILTDEELVERNDMIKANKYFTEAELKAETAKTAEQYEGIWDYVDADVVKLERELEQLSVEEELYEDLVVKMKTAHSQSIEDITSCTNETKMYASTEEKCAEKCTKAVEMLQEVNIANQKKIQELSQLYMKAQKYPLFIHQMSLDQYLQKCDSFSKCADTYMQKNFKVQDAFDDDNELRDSDIAAIVEEIEEINDRLFTANYALYMEKMTTFAQSKLVENLRAQNWMPTTLNVMKNEVDRLKIRNEQEYSPTVERLTNQLQSQLNRIVEQQGEMVIYENNKEKYDRAQKRLSHLKKFVEIVSDGMMNAECVWILMQLDIERVKKRNDFDTKSDENRSDVQNCNRRTEIMNTIGMSTSEDQFAAHFVDQMLAIFMQHNPGRIQSNENALIDAIAASDSFNVNLIECLKDIACKKAYQQIDTFTAEIQNAKADLLRFIVDGAVNSYQYWCIDFVKKRKSLELKMAELTKQTEYYKEEFRQYCNKYNEKTLWRQKQVLWIWFLTEPNKVIKAVKAISAEAQSRSKPLMAKPVAGLLRK